MNTYLQTLIEDHMTLADKIVNIKKRTLPKYIDVDDLRSAAYFGLVEAAGRYDASKGVLFSTFAYTRIWGAIIDHLRMVGKNMINLSSFEKDDNFIDIMDDQPKQSNKEEVLEFVSFNLGEQAKDIFRLYFYENMSMKEIGTHFKITESRVSQLLSEYKKNIRQRWTLNEFHEEIAA